MRAPAYALVFVCALAAGAPEAAADNKREAAAHFARAQSAEKSQDFKGAIAEYGRAYALSPHPAVLYNIAVDYERLGELRQAARYFLQYVHDSPDADDRDEVRARVAALRKRPSTVSFQVQPPQATLFIDGQARGTGSQTLKLSSGRHQIHLAREGQRSPARQLLCEFGETLTVKLDLDARPGILQVDANVRGAQVDVDGVTIGRTPFVGPVPAGDHMVLVSMVGYRAVQRQVSVPPQGSEQVRANLDPLEGEHPEGGGGHKLLLGTGYGFDGQSGGRWILALGYRTPGDRFETSLLLGDFGADVGGGVGGDLRLYLTTARLRPYLRAGALFGTSGKTSGTAVEGGFGLLWGGAARRVGPYRQRSRFGLEYYLEAGVQLTTSRDDPTGSDQGSKIGFPVLFGLLARFG